MLFFFSRKTFIVNSRFKNLGKTFPPQSKAMCNILVYHLPASTFYGLNFFSCVIDVPQTSTYQNIAKLTLVIIFSERADVYNPRKEQVLVSKPE